MGEDPVGYRCVCMYSMYMCMYVCIYVYMYICMSVSKKESINM